MIKIGAVTIDISHPLAFSNYLKDGKRARYAAVYNDSFRGEDEVDAFVKKYGVEKKCKTLEELADYVDIGFVHSCNWDKHLRYAQPFIDRGKPVFIDKPIVGNITDCRKIEDLVSNGAVILGSSSVRYAQEVVDFAARPESERGKILNIFGTAGVDEFNYAVHIVEAIGAISGTGAVSTAFIGSSRIDGKVCETFFVKFAGGITATYNIFQGTWQPFEVVAMTTKNTFQFRIDTGKIYGALLDRICDYMESGQNRLAPVEAITESVRIMLAGCISRQSGGKEVKLVDIPEDDPGYDGAEFERKYAASAQKIYL